MSNYFSLFGLPVRYEQDKEEIKKQYYALQLKFHPDKYAHATRVERQSATNMSSVINDAYQTLTHPLKRALYLLKVLQIEVDSETDVSMPEEFLEKQLQWREALASSENKEQVKAEIETQLVACEEELTHTFKQSHLDKAAARLSVRKLQFLTHLYESIEK